MDCALKVIVWGLGRHGKSIVDILGCENIIAIIESDQEKLAQETYLGIPIIDFDTYRNSYSKYYIVISPMKYTDIENKLKQYNVSRFFTFNRCKVKKAVLLELINDSFVTQNEIDTEKQIYVCGKDFSAIYIYLYLREKGITVRYADIFSERGDLLDELVNDRIIDDYVVNIPDVSDTYVIATEKETNSFKYSKCGILDYNELNRNAYARWKEDLRKFKNYHNGDRVFIIATGPSLKADDVEKLRDNCEITMSANYIYRLFEQTDWRPDYYVISDGVMMREYERDNVDLERNGIVNKFFSDSYLKFWDKPVNDTYHGYSMEYNYDKIRFSTDCSEVVYSGGTVIYVCLQLAVYMGFKEIYLLGCDFDYSSVGHFYAEQKHTVDFDYELVRRAYLTAQKYALEHGVKIYNATRGGKLDIFERRDFDELFATH